MRLIPFNSQNPFILGGEGTPQIGCSLRKTVLPLDSASYLRVQRVSCPLLYSWDYGEVYITGKILDISQNL